SEQWTLVCYKNDNDISTPDVTSSTRNHITNDQSTSVVEQAVAYSGDRPGGQLVDSGINVTDGLDGTTPRPRFHVIVTWPMVSGDVRSGRLKAVYHPNGSMSQYNYDAFGRITEELSTWLDYPQYSLVDTNPVASRWDVVGEGANPNPDQMRKKVYEYAQ